MSISFTMTAGEIVKQAMVELAVLSSGGEPKASEMADALVRLNLMLKAWAADGTLPWMEADGTVSTVAGQARVALTPRPAAVSEMRIAYDGIERALTPWAWGEYAMLPTKGALGTPVAYAQRETNDGTSVYLWPTPDRAMTLRYTYGRVLADVADASDALDVPQRWLQAITLNLAAHIAPMFGVVGSDSMALIVQRAEMAKQQMMAADRPASYYMEIDRYW